MGNKWPKIKPELTEKQKIVSQQFYIQWHEALPTKYSIFEKFNQDGGFSKKGFPPECRTLEVGAGIGGHIAFENLAHQEYYALELRPEMAERCRQRFPTVKVIVGDIQKEIDLPNEYFDRIIAVHVLEHLNDLPTVLQNIRRLLKPNGFCEFVIPCEGGLAYSFCRAISTKRLFEKTYKMPYDWFIKSEHVNTCVEILEELRNAGFRTSWQRYFPFPVPFVFCNIAVGVRCYLIK